MRKRKRILCALLAAAMLMDVGSLPVGAAALGSDVRVASEVQNTEGPALQTEITPSEPITGEPIYSTEGSYAYYDADKHQVVWYNSDFKKGIVYKINVGDNRNETVSVMVDGVLKLSLFIDGTVCVTAVKTDEIEKKYKVQINASIVGTKGVVKEYPGGKLQAEDLKEVSETGSTGKIIFVYADANENNLVLIRNSQNAPTVDLSEVKNVNHVAVVDYEKNPDGSYVYGRKRQLVYETVGLAAPTFESITYSDRAFTFSWKKVADAKKYYVYRTDSKGNFTGERTTRTSNYHTLLGADGNTKYYYVIVAATTGRKGEILSPGSRVVCASPTMIVPAQVQGLKAVAGDGQVSLNWSKTPNATKYVVMQSMTGSRQWQEVATTTSTSYVCNNVTNGECYSFRIYAIRTMYGKDAKGAYSSQVAAKPVMKKPTTPTSFTVTETSSGNKLTWKSSGKVTGFIVYSYDYDKSKYVKLATVKNATSYIHKGAKSTERYKYAVRAYRSEGSAYLESALAEKVIFGKKLVSSTNSTVHPLYYTAYMKKKIGMFKTQWETSSSKYIRVIKKGTKVTVIRLHPSKPKIRLSDGTEGYTYRGALRLSSELYTSKQYTKQQVECFVNQRTYTSNTKYLIWIATYPQTIYVFKGSKGNWTLVRSGRCATGAITTPDYPGEKKVSGKKRWHYYGKRFYQYLSILNDGNTIHTRPAYRKSGKYVDSRLGRPLSHGCIRVTDADGGYIYKNCGKGTKVVVY